MAGNKPLMDEDDINVLNRCVLVTNLKLFMGSEQVTEHFSHFGNVENLSFVHRPDRIYTRSCIVLMETEEDVNRILASSSHTIYGGEVTCYRYMGMDAHEELLYSDGKFKMQISAKDLEGSAQERYETVENYLHPNYRTMEFYKNDPSVLEISFETKEHMEEAKSVLPYEQIVKKVNGSVWKKSRS